MDDQPPLLPAKDYYGGLAIAVLLVAVSATGLWHWCGRWLRVAVLTAKRDAT